MLLKKQFCGAAAAAGFSARRQTLQELTANLWTLALLANAAAAAAAARKRSLFS
jgi:hypothetical protein